MAGGVGFFKKTSPIVPYEGERDTKDGICKMEQNGAGVRMFTNQDLKRLILPLIVEQILAVSVGMVDTMMVSNAGEAATCLLYTSPSPRDRTRSRMPSSA